MPRYAIKYYIIFTFIIIFNNKFLFASPELASFNKIKKLAHSNNHTGLEKAKWKFFKKFPKSKYIADIRMFSAGLQPDPNKAIPGYRIIIKNYHYFNRRDLAYLNLANLYSLIGQWKNSLLTCEAALLSYPKSIYYFKLKYHLCYALYYINQYEKCLQQCNVLLNNYSSNKQIAKIRLLKEKIQYKIEGNSTSYVNNLINLTDNTSTSKIASLYMLGIFFESKTQYSYAYSAYKDLIKKYPRSPEADMARLKIKHIFKFKPAYTNRYLHKKNIAVNKDNLDISPEININDSIKNKNSFYAVVIGSFYNLKKAEELKKILKAEFKPVIIIKREKSFEILIGQSATVEQTVTLKIRLAEEFEINGRIIFIKIDRGRYYFYGE